MLLKIVLVGLCAALFIGAFALARLRAAREQRLIDRNRARSRRNRSYGYAWNLVRRRKRPLMIEHHEESE